MTDDIRRIKLIRVFSHISVALLTRCSFHCSFPPLCSRTFSTDDSHVNKPKRVNTFVSVSSRLAPSCRSEQVHVYSRYSTVLSGLIVSSPKPMRSDCVKSINILKPRIANQDVVGEERHSAERCII